MRKRKTLCAIAALVAAGCGQRGAAPPEFATTPDKLTAILNRVRAADQVTLYEGLPHQNFEAAVLAAELKTKATVKFDVFPFYAETLPLKDGDAQWLTDQVCAAGVFARFSGEKFCGGFHPDYCLEWRSAGQVYRMLLCFGCGEAVWFGPAQIIRLDVESTALKALTGRLIGYHKNRPAMKLE